jgi:AcrR family transcriptional regulator
MSDPQKPPPDSDPSREAARLAILDATAAVCAERGYPDATVREIAARAGVGIDTFKWVFGTKEDAFLALLWVEERRLLGKVEEACDKAKDPPSRIEGGLRAALEWVDENPREARVCIVEPTRATTRIFEKREQTLERLAGLLRTNSPPAPSYAPELLEDLLVAGVCEALGGRLGSGDPERAIDLAPELTELLLGPYLPPEP